LPAVLDIETVKTLTGDKFDQSKFDALEKNEDGTVSSDAFVKLLETDPTGTEAAATPTLAPGDSPVPEPVPDANPPDNPLPTVAAPATAPEPTPPPPRSFEKFEKGKMRTKKSPPPPPEGFVLRNHSPFGKGYTPPDDVFTMHEFVLWSAGDEGSALKYSSPLPVAKKDAKFYTIHADIYFTIHEAWKDKGCFCLDVVKKKIEGGSVTVTRWYGTTKQMKSMSMLLPKSKAVGTFESGDSIPGPQTVDVTGSVWTYAKEKEKDVEGIENPMELVKRGMKVRLPMDEGDDLKDDLKMAVCNAELTDFKDSEWKLHRLVNILRNCEDED